uniref:Sm domain-containing protein n=1 Tax=Trypanosoma congolense (strain IL3000) TaxID=1068625 RepID=G0US53_TRYCI|nr:conserved hypothetical protein [Trypanosoma congolense IL3000]
MEGSHSSNTERLEYLYLNLVGQVIQVRLVDNSSVEGIFVACTDVDADTEAGIMLCCTRYLVSGRHTALSPSCTEFTDDIVIPYHKILMMEVQNAKIRTETPGRADTGRSEFSAAKFDWADDGVSELLESEPHQTGTWNQFEANEKSFGVKTTYKEELYTTRLDHSKITEEQRAEADRLAREIEGSSTRGVAHRIDREECLRDDEGLDEGALYSDVQRPQEKKPTYVPPSATGRKPVTEVQPPPAAAGPPAPAGAGVMDESAMHHKRMSEEQHHPSLDANQTPAGFNPAAAPYTPMKPGAVLPVVNFLEALAEAISGNEMCYECDSHWPGMCNIYYDQDDSSYSQQNYEAAAMPSSHGMGMQMYVNSQPGMPNAHRGFQGPVGRAHHGQSMPMHHMQGQGFHHDIPHHQPFHGMGNYQPPQHHEPPVQDYVPHKGQQGGMGRPAMRQGKGGGASRVEPQQPVSANIASPPPLPTVDSAPGEVKHASKLQRGRGVAAIQKNDADGDTGGAVPQSAGPKKRGGK